MMGAAAAAGGAGVTTNVVLCSCGRTFELGEFKKRYPRRTGEFCSKSCASRYSNMKRKVHGSRATVAQQRRDQDAAPQPTGDMLAGL